MAESVTIEVQGHAAIVTIRRPKVRNALGPADARALSEAINSAAADPGVAGVVLTGEGAFSAGGDLPAIMAAIDGLDAASVSEVVYGDFQAIARSLRDCPVPTAAAIGGAAIGLGLDLALWCDMRFLGPGAKLAQGWAALGLIPGTGGAGVLQRAMPGAIWHLLGKPPINAEEAAHQGFGVLVDDPVQACVDRINEWQSIGRGALEGYARLTRVGLPDDGYLRECARIQGTLLTSAKFIETAKKVLAR